MSLKDQLLAEMNEALRAREAGRTRLRVIRMIRSAVRNVEIEKRKELDDEEVLEVIAREAKQKRETIEAFAQAGREQKVKQLKEELEVLEGYLPRQLSAEELRELASQLIDELGASGPSDLGRVMGAIMPRVKGRAAGSVVNRIVRELLQS